jgi:hypothetical protein
VPVLIWLSASALVMNAVRVAPTLSILKIASAKASGCTTLWMPDNPATPD